MKKFSAFFMAIAITIVLFAQTPQKISYQAVIRDVDNSTVDNTTLGMRISILQGAVDGTAVYSETQTAITNANGLVSLEIGTGTVETGDFALIDWSAGVYFIETEIDPLGGTNYTITGTSQLLSVPYALYSKSAESVENLNISGDEVAFDLWDKDVLDDFSGDYNDLINQPQVITTAQADAIVDNTTHAGTTTGNPHGVTQIDVGLGNVDNTSDADKIISTATQIALDSKADASNVLGLDNISEYVPDADYEPATKKYVDDSVITPIQADAIVANTIHTGTTIGNPHNVTQTDVGLANVDNTSDADKPVSIATQTALEAKADASNVLGLDNTIEYVPDADYEPATKKYVDDSVITTAQADAIVANTIHSVTTTGNPHAVTQANVGLGNVDNTSDADKPVSTATQTALDAKANTNNVLTLNNTVEFIPDADYEPATKKYVDDAMPAYYIGQVLSDGVVFYVDETGNHGLVVGFNDASSFSPWGQSSSLLNASSLWDGDANSDLIAVGALETDAVRRAQNYDGGTAGWYLPSIDELSLLYQNRYAVNKALSVTPDATEIGFVKLWSSTEYDAIQAWKFSFDIVGSGYSNKTESMRVRAVRAF
jgi:hypothetical protein